jgi:hypothetical protein
MITVSNNKDKIVVELNGQTEIMSSKAAIDLRNDLFIAVGIALVHERSSGKFR